MTPKTTSIGAASTLGEDPQAAQWRQWQASNEDSNRTAAARMRIVFAVLLIAAGAWLGLELLPSQPWA